VTLAPKSPKRRLCTYWLWTTTRESPSIIFVTIRVLSLAGAVAVLYSAVSETALVCRDLTRYLTESDVLAPILLST
jgi:hypothetical protein